MADSDSWDADNFELNEPAKKSVALLDKWEGEDEDEDVKDNWDDDEEEGEQKEEEKKQPEGKLSQKKRINEKIKEKENKQKKEQDELRKRLKETEESKELSPEELAAEKLRQQQLQEEADLELAREAFGGSPVPAAVTSGVDSSSSKNSVSAVLGIDSLQPSSREDFATLEKMLTEKITQFEKSIHYSNFLESLFRELCISLEVEDLKKINTSLSVLLNEKQKAEKAKGKKKKKSNLPSGGLKAKMKDDLDDYGGFGAGYEQDYEDFM